MLCSINVIKINIPTAILSSMPVLFEMGKKFLIDVDAKSNTHSVKGKIIKINSIFSCHF